MRTSRDPRRTASAPVCALLAVVLVATACGAADVTDEPTGQPAPSRGETSAAAPDTSADDAAEPGGDSPQTFTPARSPRDLADRVVAAEEVVLSPATPRATLRNAAFEAQLLYRQLARRDRWLPRVLADVPRRHRATVRAHVVARQSFRSLHHSLSSTLPAWRIVPPAPARELRSYYREGERRFGVPWEVLAAVNLVETGMGRIRGTSYAGARGPMQFMPATWAAFGKGDIDDPHDAIMAAARYLAHNGGGRGRIDNALYRYNNHWGYVRGVKAYASVMERHPRAYRGFHQWQVVYLSAIGDVWLPVGYERRSPLPVRTYVRRHPDRLLGTSTR